ncbi:hypothetical protein ACTFIW_006609 [Dictyostelium discoideum]
MALNSIHVQFYINLPIEPINPPFSSQSLLMVFSPQSNGLVGSTSNTDFNNLKQSLSIDSELENLNIDNINNNNNNNNNIKINNNHQSLPLSISQEQQMIQNLSQSPPTMVTKDEMIESLKSRINNTPSKDHHVSSNSNVVGGSGGGVGGGVGGNGGVVNSSSQYNFRSHQFMIAPTTSNEYSDPFFLKESIESSMDDLYYLLQELTNANCYEWVLVIATVLLNPVLISKTLKKIPDIYENYCKMLSLQKPIGYNQLLKFIEDSVYPLLQQKYLDKK